MNRPKLVEIIKKISNYKWEARDNKHTVGIMMEYWIKEIEDACKEKVV